MQRHANINESKIQPIRQIPDLTEAERLEKQSEHMTERENERGKNSNR